MDRTYIPVNSIVDVPYKGEWVAGAAIKKGEFRTYGGLLFMANLAHTSTYANAPYADPAVIYARQYRGVYSAATTYAKYDAVTYGRHAFYSLIENNLNHTPNSGGISNAYWGVYAVGGVDGDQGPQGVQGDPGGEANHWAIQETPTGAMDGTNKSFTLAHTPTSPVIVIFNGREFQDTIDYSSTGTALTLITFAPNDAVGDRFWVRYTYD